LPQAADETAVTARYENGVLSLELAKKPGNDTRKIKID